MAIEQVKIPDLGGAENVDVIELCVAVGDVVEQEDSLVVLETDKASMEVPAPIAGKITAIHIAEGGSVNEGELCVDIEVEGAAAEVAPAPVAVTEAPAPAPEPLAAAAPAAASAEEKVSVPDLGGAADVEVIEVCVAVGDEIEEGDSIVVLETDKASMEVPSPVSGKVVSLAVAEGAKVNDRDDLAVILAQGVASKAAPVAAAAPAAAPEAAPVATPAAAPVAAEQDIVVPDLGGASDVDVIEVCVAVGDELAEGDSIIVLETDKASMEIPADSAGVIVELTVTEGGKVNEGDVIGKIKSASAAPAPTAAAPSAAAPAPAPAPAAPKAGKLPPAATEAGASMRESHAGPAVRKLARELGVNLAKVKSTGPRGRILKDDLHDYVKNAMKAIESGSVSSPAAVATGSGLPARPSVDFSKFGEIETEAMSKIDRLTALNMQRSWLNVPHVTQFDDADITDLEEFRKSLKKEGEKRGIKVTPVAFLIKAAASALKQNPKFNASLDASMENRIYKKYVNIGMAVDTPRGLVVPVIKDADKKGIWDIAKDVIELSTKAREGKLKPAEMQGGCFTISSLGPIGGTGFTPIVNTPEVGILGVSKSAMKPVWNGSEFVPRNMLPLALSYDHCAINGGDAGRFMTTIVNELSDIRRLVLG